MQKSVIVTGSSSGIGLSTCQYLKSKDYRVFATARKITDVQRLQQEGFESLQLDVTSAEQIQETIAKVKELTGGTLYALVNNAGYGQPGAIEDLSVDDMRTEFETNVFGLHAMTKAVLPIMRQQGYGRIVHLSSVLGIVCFPFLGAYNASKYAVEALADTLRLELRGSDIYVSLIEPGPIRTQFRNAAVATYRETIIPDTSHFREHYHRSMDNYEKATRGLEPIYVAKKIADALHSARPKARYRVTAQAHSIAILKRFLPQCVLDLILAKAADHEIN